MMETRGIEATHSAGADEENVDGLIPGPAVSV